MVQRMNRLDRFRSWLAKQLLGEQLSSISPNLRTDDYWQSHQAREHDRPSHEISSQYNDALEAWRKNPLAWRMIQITSDYVIGEGLEISSPNAKMQEFIEDFWHHPDNNIHHRLENICDELSRSGDLFPILFREKHTGISVLRFITKDQVITVSSNTDCGCLRPVAMNSVTGYSTDDQIVVSITFNGINTAS